ncbi:MAG: siphovirus Gp157 family protein [Sulfurimonas sp.]|nr:siphovirus Gp157 family protein [Sulfurimonas sp.]
MKLVNYQLQTQMESVKQEATHFLKEYLQSILEDKTKAYYQKADYVGLSLNELSNKIDTLSEDIKELQQLKKRLSTALDISKEVTATILLQNGIDRIEGTIISSITLSKESTKEKVSMAVLNKEELLKRGFVKYELDTDALQTALLQDTNLQRELKPFVEIVKTKETTPAKAKVNLKRSANNTQADELLQLVQNQAA